MTEPSRSAWGRAVPSASSDTAVPEQSVRATDFPVLGTKGPSKAAARKRDVYALNRKTFDAYPPRNEVLARRQMEQQQQQLDEWRSVRDGTLSSEMVAWEQVEEERRQQNDAQATNVRQQYGMSSVTFYDKTSARTNARLAIYGKAASRSGDATPSREVDNSNKQRRYDASVSNELPGLSFAEINGLPQPLTIDRIDALTRETQRAQRARAARRRHLEAAPNGHEGHDKDGVANASEQPLMDEVARALSSVEGFMAAFGTGVVPTGAT